jgi:hypothetical protein
MGIGFDITSYFNQLCDLCALSESTPRVSVRVRVGIRVRPRVRVSIWARPRVRVRVWSRVNKVPFHINSLYHLVSESES